MSDTITTQHASEIFAIWNERRREIINGLKHRHDWAVLPVVDVGDLVRPDASSVTATVEPHRFERMRGRGLHSPDRIVCRGVTVWRGWFD